MEHEWEPPEAAVAALRADMRHVTADVADLRAEMRELRAEMRADIRRLDERLFQLLLAQLATLATALGTLVAVLAA